MDNRVSAEAVIAKYEVELAQVMRRALIAEAHAEALGRELEKVQALLPKDTEPGPEEGEDR